MQFDVIHFFAAILLQFRFLFSKEWRKHYYEIKLCEYVISFNYVKSKSVFLVEPMNSSAVQ